MPSVCVAVICCYICCYIVWVVVIYIGVAVVVVDVECVADCVAVVYVGYATAHTFMFVVSSYIHDEFVCVVVVVTVVWC